MSFDLLDLPESILQAVEHAGYTQPTPIQQQSIPAIREGRDLLAAAQTGTGKTAAFVLPMLERLAAFEPAQGGHTSMLILTPTRELAAQIAETVNVLSYGQNVRCVEIYGGVKPGPQIQKLKRGVDILVACPGRLLDHARNGDINFRDVDTLVLDEADRMLDMGFIHDIKRLMKMLPPKRQTLLFSATFSTEIRNLAAKLLRDPVTIDIAPRNTAAETVEHSCYTVAKNQKTPLLVYLIKEHGWQQVLVFSRTKHGANKLVKLLNREGIESAPIHGNKSQAARQRALAGFKALEIPVLVATDIAARGLDIAELPVVVNYDLPNIAADYVHRIGRTGRAGHSGQAVSLVGPDDQPYLRDIEKLLGQSVTELSLADIELPALTPGQTQARQPADKSAKPANNQTRKQSKKNKQTNASDQRDQSEQSRNGRKHNKHKRSGDAVTETANEGPSNRGHNRNNRGRTNQSKKQQAGDELMITDGNTQDHTKGNAKEPHQQREQGNRQKRDKSASGKRNTNDRNGNERNQRGDRPKQSKQPRQSRQDKEANGNQRVATTKQPLDEAGDINGNSVDYKPPKPTKPNKSNRFNKAKGSGHNNKSGNGQRQNAGAGKSAGGNKRRGNNQNRNNSNANFNR